MMVAARCPPASEPATNQLSVQAKFEGSDFRLCCYRRLVWCLRQTMSVPSWGHRNRLAGLRTAASELS